MDLEGITGNFINSQQGQPVIIRNNLRPCCLNLG